MWSNVEIHRSACRNGGGADASPHAHGTASARRWVSKQASSKKQFLACLLGGLLKAERFPRFLAGGETRNPSIADSVSRLRLSIHRRYPSSRSHVAVSVDLDARGQWGLAERAIERQRERDSGVETASRRTDHGNPDRSENGTECSASTHQIESSTPTNVSSRMMMGKNGTPPPPPPPPSTPHRMPNTIPP